MDWEMGTRMITVVGVTVMRNWRNKIHITAPNLFASIQWTEIVSDLFFKLATPCNCIRIPDDIETLLWSLLFGPCVVSPSHVWLSTYNVLDFVGTMCFITILILYLLFRSLHLNHIKHSAIEIHSFCLLLPTLALYHSWIWSTIVAGKPTPCATIKELQPKDPWPLDNE